MCSKIVTTAANVTAALTTTQTPALTLSSTANNSTAAATASSLVLDEGKSLSSCSAYGMSAIETVSTTEPTSILTQQSAAVNVNLSARGTTTMLHNDISNTVIGKAIRIKVSPLVFYFSQSFDYYF